MVTSSLWPSLRLAPCLLLQAASTPPTRWWNQTSLLTRPLWPIVGDIMNGLNQPSRSLAPCPFRASFLASTCGLLVLRLLFGATSRPSGGWSQSTIKLFGYADPMVSLLLLAMAFAFAVAAWKIESRAFTKPISRHDRLLFLLAWTVATFALAAAGYTSRGSSRYGGVISVGLTNATFFGVLVSIVYAASAWLRLRAEQLRALFDDSRSDNDEGRAVDVPHALNVATFVTDDGCHSS